MNTFIARKVLRELSENMIPLLDDETYWPLAERIIACPGTLLTTNSTTLGDDASAESMDIIEDERDTRQEGDLMAMENLGLTKVRRTKESNPLDLPIGSIGTYKNHMSCQYLRLRTKAVVARRFTKDPRPNRRRSVWWLASTILEANIGSWFVREMHGKHKGSIVDKVPVDILRWGKIITGLHYKGCHTMRRLTNDINTQVYDIIENAMSNVDVRSRVQSMTEVFCYRPALFHYVIRYDIGKH